MIKTFMETGVVAISGTFRQKGTINLIEARTLSITARATFNGSATDNATINIFYSANGSDFDTIPYTSFDLALTTGVAVQRTVPIDVPEHGFIKIHIVNNDSGQTMTNVKAWFTIQSWLPKRETKGSIETPSGEALDGSKIKCVILKEAR